MAPVARSRACKPPARHAPVSLRVSALDVKVSRAPRREILAWAMYDFANSGYTTVVLTAIFNAYFVAVVAGEGAAGNGAGTLLWTMALGVSNFLVLVSAPVIGAIADHRAFKKRFLALTTAGCVIATALLGLVDAGDVVLGMTLVAVATFMFSSGENLIAAFLPEISPAKDMGRISGYGWSLGYVGGLLVLGACLVYIAWAESQGQTAAQFVPVTMWITAGVFGLAALPTFLWLRERSARHAMPPREGYVVVGFGRVRRTLAEASRFRDLFRFLLSLATYYCGINTVVVLAAVYAQQAMGFGTQETIFLILVVNITASIGAFLFGHVQDWFGSVRTLAVTLLLWIAALVLAYFIEGQNAFWVVANMIGLALGASQSAGRALIGQFAPRDRAAEFFGLWGLAGKLAAVIGPLSYGFITYATHGDHRMALLSTALFFIVGLVLLGGVDERRGREAARSGP